LKGTKSASDPKRKSGELLLTPQLYASGIQDSINLLVQTDLKGKPVERRLAAILAADVVGYSRLVELDEASPLATLKERRRES
jgi:class 3 adenylate cyclase